MDVTYARLNAASKYLGNNPHHGFYVSICSTSLEKQVASITEQISVVAASTNIDSLIYEIRKGGGSLCLFQIYSSLDYRIFENCHIKQVSDWSFNRLLEKYEEWQTDAALELFNLFRVWNGLQIATFIWEQQFFRSLRSPCSFILRSLDDPNESIPCEWEYPGGAEYQTFKSGSFPTRLQVLIKDKISGHLKPLSTMFPTFDSLLHQPSHLDFLQITIGSLESNSSISGFERIQRWLKFKGPTHLRPSETQPWMFIFIIPEEKAASLKQQSFGKIWNSKVKQYVLGLSQKDIWECWDIPLACLSLSFLNRYILWAQLY